MKRTAMLLSAMIIFLTVFPMRTIAADEGGVLSAYVLMESSTRTVLESENADIPLNVGYMSKLMTLLLIAEDIETGRYLMSTELTASSNVTGTRGSVIWLETGDKLTVEELIKAVVIGNANDAVTVLAERSEESVEKFVQRMNKEAFELGLRNTAFFSPYGYSDERGHSTAHDLGVICCELAKYDFMRPIFATWRDFVKEGAVELVNENTLSRTYERHIGFKAAHSENSGYCVAEGGENDSGVSYIAVILGAADDSCLGTAKKLVNSGFSGYKLTATMFPDEMLMPIKVRNGRESAVEISLRCQSRLVIPKAVAELNTAVVLPEYLDAPVKKGQAIGTAAFYSDKNQVCEIEIVTCKSVERLTFGYVFKELLLNLLR